MQEIACFFAFSAITGTKKRTEVRLLFRVQRYKNGYRAVKRKAM